MNTAVRRPGPKLWLALLTILLGMAVGVTSVVVLVVNVSDEILGSTYPIPSTISLHLGTGTQTILERTGGQSSFDARSNISLDPTKVQIEGPGGERVSVTYASNNETLTRPNGTFVSALEFDARRSGNYRLHFRGTTPEMVMVQRPLGDVARRSVIWVLGIGLGGLLVLAGIVMLIVGIVRRSKAKQLAMASTYGTSPGFPPTAAPSTVAVPLSAPTTAPLPVAAPTSPAAWHPDPHGQHRLRYWDGSTWTDHTWD